ncbi:MAG: HD-GYP domain-containing protein [Bacillota bacterium]
MRFIPSKYLRPGMVLNRDLFDADNKLLLSAGQSLTERSIRIINDKHYRGVYIQDSLIEEMVLEEESISQALRNTAVRSLKDFFSSVRSNNMMMSREALAGIKDVVDEMIQDIAVSPYASSSMTDLKIFDDYTYYHSVNVTVISLLLGMAINLKREELRLLGLGAMLHDIGKIFLPKNILDKQEPLTDNEFLLIKSHANKGYKYLISKWEIPVESCVAVLSHHEKFDGSGYPNSSMGLSIPRFGRIVAVADVYDALTSDRPYREALLPSEAMEYIIGNCYTHFDPHVVNTFLQKISPYPIGTHVILSNGLEGIVIENHPQSGLRPKIKIISDSSIPIYCDLATDLNMLDVTIVGISYK